MDEFLKGLARKLAEASDFDEPYLVRIHLEQFERVLWESGIGELLEAGQALRNQFPKYCAAATILAWDIQLKRVRAALAGAEKGREAK